MNKLVKILLIVLIISLIFNIYFISRSFSQVQGGSISNSEKIYNMDLDLIDKSVAELNLQDFIKNKQEYIASYSALKNNIETFILTQTGHFAVYFEDLHSHSWFGINEKERFKPASLLKTTTVASILNLLEGKELSLDTEVELTEDDINDRFGELYKEKGSKITIKELIERALINSDNTAVKTLHQFISDDKWIETRLAMGLPLVSIEESTEGTALSPKEFSRVFHSLYYSGYLSRESSNWMLSLLSQTEFNEGIPAGVPSNVKVSHKIGVWLEQGEVHDCGIVYAKRPYILCIMSSGVNEQQGEGTIKEISKQVYDYVSTV
jgi:beta-lactamase class A